MLTTLNTKREVSLAQSLMWAYNRAVDQGGLSPSAEHHYMKRADHIDRLIHDYNERKSTVATGYVEHSKPGQTIIEIHSKAGYELSCKVVSDCHTHINSNQPVHNREESLARMAAHLDAQKVYLMKPVPNLVRACKLMMHDYQSSINHHPDQILVPREAFEEMVQALIQREATDD